MHPHGGHIQALCEHPFCDPVIVSVRYSANRNTNKYGRRGRCANALARHTVADSDDRDATLFVMEIEGPNAKIQVYALQASPK